MKNTPLYVPIELDVLLLGDSHSELELVEYAPKYNELNQDNLFGDKIVNSSTVFRAGLPGAHLHWLLPDALLHGKQDENGELEFPEVPNRWLVLRMSTDGHTICRKAWIIQSDKLSFSPAKTESGMEKSAIPCIAYNEKKKIWVPAGNRGAYYVYLGDAQEYGNEQEPPEKSLDRLTAIGAGDHLFSAMYPLCKTIFGFYDPLEDADAGSYTYTVFGYYSTDTSDPLSEKTADEIMSELSWTWENKEAVPNCTILHGSVYGVEWKGRGCKYIETDKTKMDIALANTSAEALSAYMQKAFPDSVKMERMLNALQMGLLEELGNSAQEDNLITFENKIHERQFEAARSGKMYCLRAADSDQIAGTVSQAQFELLAAVNKGAESYYQLEAEIQDLSEEIYFLWHKYASYMTSPFGSERADKIKTSLDQRLDEYEKKKKDADGLKDNLEKEILSSGEKLAKDGLTLCDFPQTYYRGNDPAVLLIDTKQARTRRQGFQCGEEGTLPCRMGLHTSLNVTLENGATVAIDKADLTNVWSTLSKPLPEAAENIGLEAILYSGDFAQTLAEIAVEKAGMEKTETTLTSAKDSVVKQQEQDRSFSEAPTLAALKIWQQPWHPVVLDWEAVIQPARTDTEQDNSIDAFQLGEIDFESSKTEFESTDVQVKGQILLTPHVPYVFGKMVEKAALHYTEESDEYKEIMEFAGELGNREILSQQLTGFHEALMGLHWVPNMPILPLSNKAKDVNLAARVGEAVEDLYPVTILDGGKESYVPMRAGFLRLTGLRLIDSFGQYRNIDIPDDITIGESLRCGRDNVALLPPRFPVDVRLQVEWLCSKENDTDALFSPVAGFLAVNNLDFSIQVYSREGAFKGWIQRTDEGVKWRPNPGTGLPAEELSNPDLKCFVSSVLHWDNDKFTGFMADLEKFFSEKTPADGAPAFLSNCLALVRAEVAVHTAGRLKQYWGTEESLDGGYADEKFSLKIGDMRLSEDGVAIFFADKDGAMDYDDYDTSGGEVCGVTLNNPQRSFSLLMDPYRKMMVRTGFTPAYALSLPAELYKSQIESMKPMLCSWPVLATQNGDFPVIKLYAKDMNGIAVESDGAHSFKMDKKLPNESVDGRMCIREIYMEAGE